MGSAQAAPDGADRRRSRRRDRTGELSYRKLAQWSAQRPHEVPRTSTSSGIGGDEFERTAAFIPSTPSRAVRKPA